MGEDSRQVPSDKDRLGEKLVSLLACPVDKGPLKYLPGQAALINPRLKVRYPVSNGVPLLRPADGTRHDD